MNEKLYIIDTNVLLHDPRAIYGFSDGIIVIHFSVLGELESFKTETSERGYNARESIRIFDELKQKGSLNTGIKLDNGGIIKVIMPAENKTGVLTNSVDDQIILGAISLKNSNNDVIIVSQDLALRIKADLFSIRTIEYKNENINRTTFYKGWKEFYYPSGDIKFSVEKILKEIQSTYQFTANEFALLKSSHADEFYRIFRYIGPDNFIEVRREENLIWGIEPRNAQQEMVLNLLMDDSIQLVILNGPSGTGKTFMVLTAMVHKLLCTQTYQKLLISRPLVPLGPDLGYLPGDLYEKLQTWMQPIKDNLEFLLYRINESYENSGTICEAVNTPPKKSNKKGRKYNWSPPAKKTVTLDDLLGYNGRINLEAITYMRGRSIPFQAIFIDEVQNLTPHEVKTLISRAGEGSKIILVGDPYQIDSSYLDFETNGLIVASEKFKGQDVFGTVYLSISERSLLSSLANKLM